MIGKVTVMELQLTKGEQILQQKTFFQLSFPPFFFLKVFVLTLSVLSLCFISVIQILNKLVVPNKETSVHVSGTAGILLPVPPFLLYLHTDEQIY